MEKIHIELDDDLLQQLKTYQKADDTIEETIIRVLRNYHPGVDDAAWNEATDQVFTEFDDTFQKLAK